MTAESRTRESTVDEDELDKAIADSFPASDPPSFTRGGSNDDDSGRVDLEDEPNSNGWMKFAIPLGVLSAAGAGIFALRRRRKKKSLRAPMKKRLPV